MHFVPIRNLRIHGDQTNAGLNAAQTRTIVRICHLKSPADGLYDEAELLSLDLDPTVPILL